MKNSRHTIRSTVRVDSWYVQKRNKRSAKPSKRFIQESRERFEVHVNKLMKTLQLT